MTAKKAKPKSEAKAAELMQITDEQRKQMRAGGDYRFDPVTGKLEQTRQATRPATIKK